MRADTLAMPILQELLDCLKEEIRESELDADDDICFVSAVPGAEVAFDYDCSGMAWVKLNNAFPTNNFPIPFDPSLGPNAGVGIAFQVEVGMIHGVVGIDESGRIPDADDMLAATERQMAEMAAMHRAITCCLAGHVWPAGRELTYAITDYLPNGPEGGMVGGSWNIVVMWL